jgi:hypothetical protein
MTPAELRATLRNACASARQSANRRPEFVLGELIGRVETASAGLPDPDVERVHDGSPWSLRVMLDNAGVPMTHGTIASRLALLIEERDQLKRAEPAHALVERDQAVRERDEHRRELARVAEALGDERLARTTPLAENVRAVVDKLATARQSRDLAQARARVPAPLTKVQIERRVDGNGVLLDEHGRTLATIIPT